MNNNLVKTIYKEIGETPLEAIIRFKHDNPEYANSKISYAGRLDPMAHGLLILLIDDENKNRRIYENLEKDYIFKIIVGVSTDSYDILGLINSVNINRVNQEDLNHFINRYTGEIIQKLPPFSAYIVKGKPLYKWARDNCLDKIQIPERKVTIKEFKHISTSYIDSNQLLDIIIKRLQMVNGDFRQKDIIDLWNLHLKNIPNQIEIIEMMTTVSSGTYIRGLVNSLSQELDIPMCCLEIYRPRVDRYKLVE